MKNKDKSRKWMWWFLGVVAALQVYFVRELLAAFALFAMGFAAVALAMGSLYMLHRTWATAVERAADSKHQAMVAARQGIDVIEDLARRPFRRPGSAAARSLVRGLSGFVQSPRRGGQSLFSGNDIGTAASV